MKKKSTFHKLVAYFIFRSKGGVLNNFNSLLSPEEYKHRRSKKVEDRANELLDLLAPLPSKSPLRTVGDIGDGCYVMTEYDFKKTKYLISGGIENNNSFEVTLAESGVKGIQVDNSITTPPVIHKNLTFLKGTLGLGEEESFSINRYMNERNFSNVVLKLDIEGAEYEVINGISLDNLKKIHCLIVEFHNLDTICTDTFWNQIQSLLIKLKKVELYPCFVSANNVTSGEILGGTLIPRNIEVTFTRKRNLKRRFSSSDLKQVRSLRTINDPNLSSINIDHLIFRKAYRDV